MTSRIVVAREVVARLLVCPDGVRLSRWIFGLQILGVEPATFGGDLGRAYAALLALAQRGERVTVDAVLREARGRVDADDLEWLVVGYATEASLYDLAARLLDADRRAKADSVLRVALSVIRDPVGDVDGAITVAIAGLRRLRRPAA